MTKMVKLAVLMATLLLLSGVSFAVPCYNECYEVTVTEVDNPTNTHTACAPLQFCEDNTGSIGMPSPYGGTLSLFFDPMRDQVLGYSNTIPGCVAYVKFHGDYLYILKGIGYCVGERHNIKGHQKDCCG